MRATFALILVAGCGSTHCPPPWHHGSGHELLASIERTTCYGWCPGYKVRVFRDGMVEYEGEAYVKTLGKATGHLSPEELETLDQLFRKSGYLGLDDSYDEDATDMPTIYTSYSPGGCKKSIRHYGLGAPKALDEIEHSIDRIIRIEQWIGTADERKKSSGW